MIMTATEEKTTADILANMLKENTGTHFLDSGGDKGRAWQRNQVRDFEKENATTLSFRYGIELTHNVYHWLKGRLEYSEEFDQLFEQWAKENSKDTSWFELMETFPGYLIDEYSFDVTGIYGEGEPVTVNTYNHQSLLSQVLQFKYSECSEGAFVILQIHGGADVRGGYTKPVVFECPDNMTELAIFDDQRGTISCDKCEANWSTGDGYHFYADGACGVGAGKELQEYEVFDLDGAAWQEGKLCHDGEVGFCPKCGGDLHGSEY